MLKTKPPKSSQEAVTEDSWDKVEFASAITELSDALPFLEKSFLVMAVLFLRGAKNNAMSQVATKRTMTKL
jgi:hypothetical protein|tara:strand:+ start:4386 stop:4598 length:213 start_codon:yes stop_codon:yes gene_type:complete